MLPEFKSSGTLLSVILQEKSLSYHMRSIGMQVHRELTMRNFILPGLHLPTLSMKLTILMCFQGRAIDSSTEVRINKEQAISQIQVKSLQLMFQ